MSDRTASVLADLLRGMAAEAAVESDGALVGRFLAARDERAFEALVFRHGPMVYRVCLRNAGGPGAAEDTFLVLARDLSAVRNRESLASWLHGVARRVALKARAGAEARRVRERVAGRAEAVPPSDPARAEALTALDEELARLPDRYRLPLVLCYLDGRTHDEAARLLGWSLGTLKRRLAEARDALSARLARRGVGPAALSAVLLSECVAGAASTPRLLNSIVSTAGSQAAPLASGVPGHILSLANGVPNVFLTKTKLTIATLVLTVACGLPAAFLDAAAQPPRSQPTTVRGGDEYGYDPGIISAPVVYEGVMLVLVDKDGAAAVVFTEEVDKTEHGVPKGVRFKFRYESADGKIKSSGTGKVTEKGAVAASNMLIEAGGIALTWSWRDKGKGWVYYNPSKMSVHIAQAADFEDRLVEREGGEKPYLVPRLDLSRFRR